MIRSTGTEKGTCSDPLVMRPGTSAARIRTHLDNVVGRGGRWGALHGGGELGRLAHKRVLEVLELLLEAVYSPVVCDIDLPRFGHICWAGQRRASNQEVTRQHKQERVR